MVSSTLGPFLLLRLVLQLTTAAQLSVLWMRGAGVQGFTITPAPATPIRCGCDYNCNDAIKTVVGKVQPQAFVPPLLRLRAPSSRWRRNNTSGPRRRSARTETRLRLQVDDYEDGNEAAAGTSEEDDDDDDDDDDETANDDRPVDFNPYADPNYPDLEFVNYDLEPAYGAGLALDSDDDLGSGTEEDAAVLEGMREERRRLNDIFQYETYWTSVWGAGEASYKGEWTVYYSTAFFPEPPPPAAAALDDEEEEEEEDDGEQSLVQQPDDDNEVDDEDDDDDDGMPHLVQMSEAPLTVVSRAVKAATTIACAADATATAATADAESGVYATERIMHEQELAQPMGDADLLAMMTATTSPDEADEDDQRERNVMAQTYWPAELATSDFRGPQGIMVCGNAWTIGTAVPLVAAAGAAATADGAGEDLVGPYAEYRVELGIQADGVRFRLKLDYSVLDDDDGDVGNDDDDDDDDIDDDDDDDSPPPLYLKTLTVCREAADQWPRSAALAPSLFGAAGAPGGLYDPPPVGDAVHNYCLVDLEGGATALFPMVMEQADDEATAESSGDDDGNEPRPAAFWVTSLDWTAGPMRYQVDRKVHGGAQLLGLRTLELSEVQGANADQYRPKDGGQEMRQ